MSLPPSRAPISALLARMDASLAHSSPTGAGSSAFMGDGRNLLHDYAALFAGLSAPWRRDNVLFVMMRARFGEDHARVLEENTDVFVAAAAEGDVALLRVLFHGLASWRVDVARMMELACANGHVGAAVWIRDNVVPRGLSVDPSGLQDGVRRALEALLKKKDYATVQRLVDAQIVTEGQIAATTAHQQAEAKLKDGFSRNPPAQGRDESPHAAAAVFNYAPLMARIGSFQGDPKTEMHRFMREVFAKGSFALAPWVALQEGNLIAFKKLSKRDHPFRLAMHFAACEDQVNMLQWMHDQYKQQVSCRPDTMAMAVRCGAARAVEWLHHHRPESAQTMSTLALNEAARCGHTEVLRVCHRLSLADFTPKTLECAIKHGHAEAVRVVLLVYPEFSSCRMNTAIKKHKPVVSTGAARSAGDDPTHGALPRLQVIGITVERETV